MLGYIIKEKYTATNTKQSIMIEVEVKLGEDIF
jgi:hypothetical protein